MGWPGSPSGVLFTAEWGWQTMCWLGLVARGGSESFHLPLQWRHNEHDGVASHQPYDWLLNPIFRRRSKKTSKLRRVTDLCAGNPPMTGEFPAQRASDAENVSIWWRHHGCWKLGKWQTSNPSVTQQFKQCADVSVAVHELHSNVAIVHE